MNILFPRRLRDLAFYYLIIFLIVFILAFTSMSDGNWIAVLLVLGLVAVTMFGGYIYRLVKKV